MNILSPECPPCSRLWKRVLPLFLVIALIAFLLSLPFGDCQWSRWHYMFQKYLWPQEPNSSLRVPNDFTGIWREWHRNGQESLGESFRDGVRDGKEIAWNKEGQKIREGSYANGKKHGLWRWWDDQGRLKRQEEYANGKAHGVWLWYNEGKKSREQHYRYDVMTFCRVFQDGKKVTQWTYRDGKRHGKMIAWGSDGTIEGVTYWLHGREVTEEEFRKAQSAANPTPQTNPDAEPKERGNGKMTEAPGDGAPSQRKRTGQNDTIAEGNDDRER